MIRSRPPRPRFPELSNEETEPLSTLFLIQGVCVILLVTAFVLYRRGSFERFTELGRAGFEEKVVPSPRGQVAYLEGGAGRPTVLVLHGFADSKEAWREVALRLAKSGGRVVVPDLPGFGGSFGHDGFEATKLAAAVRQFAQTAGLETFHLVGHSTGALVAAAYAYGYPTEVASLTLIEPFGIRVPAETELDKSLARGRNPLLLPAPSAYDGLLRFVTAQPPEMKSKEKESRAAALVQNRAALQEAWAELREGKRANFLDLLLPEIRTRILVLLGGRSRVVHPRTEEAVPILNKEAQAVVLPGVGHWPMVENPEQCAAAILQFLGRK